MNNSSGKNGFTLVELLVALAIIVAIIAMVYGSYFATSKSAQVYQARLAAFKQAGKVLEQVAGQVRCSYADTNVPADTAAVFGKEKIMPENIINYFCGNSDDPGGEILSMVTTCGIFSGKQENGLFDVAYKFDKSAGTLSISQTRFISADRNPAKRRNWRLLAENIRAVELSFFDGQRWVTDWDFVQKRKLPCAVRIGITCVDENYRQYCYGTVANICCRNNRSSNSSSETLVAVEKQ